MRVKFTTERFEEFRAIALATHIRRIIERLQQQQPEVDQRLGYGVPRNYGLIQRDPNGYICRPLLFARVAQ